MRGPLEGFPDLVDSRTVLISRLLELDDPSCRAKLTERRVFSVPVI